MLHAIEGPYLNHCDPWRKKIKHEDLQSSLGATTHTVYLPEFTLSFVNGSKGKVTHTPGENSNTDYEYILILQLTGYCQIYSSNHQVNVEGGDMILLSSQNDWTIVFQEDYSQIVIRFHYAYITPLIAVKDIPLMACFTNKSGVGRLFLDYLMRLKNELDVGNISQSAAIPLSRSIINLVLACLLELNNALNNKKNSATYEYHISRIKNYIAQNLREPTLSVEVISQALSISTPHLHRIFKSEPMSISHYIWSKRLQGCVKDLSDYGKLNVSISTIAFSWGFNDAAHFSRAFKEQYGISPSNWRKKKLSNN